VLWYESLDNQVFAIVQSAITIVNDDAYIGLASKEETQNAANPNYQCCVYRGSFVKFHLPTRTVVWRFYTVPDNYGNSSGYAGASVWSSQPPVDLKRRLVYFSTGNNFHVPDWVLKCQLLQWNQTNNLMLPVQVYPNPCMEDDNYVDSIVAINIDTGKLAWSQRFTEYDVYITTCPTNGSQCPNPHGPDYDFPQSPILINNNERDILVAGQKTGILWAMDPSDGTVLWNVTVGPDSKTGGLMWGSAATQNTIYGAISNSGRLNYTLISGENITWGSYNAINRSNGNILWQTSIPSQGLAKGPVSGVNDVLFGAASNSPDNKSHYYALDINTGSTLWNFTTSLASTNAYSGAAIVNGTVYWGSDKFYAFGL